MNRSLMAALAALIIIAFAPHAALSKGAAPKPSGEIPQSIVDSIAAGELASAVIAMREQPKSPKINYLIREASRIVMAEMGKKPKRSEAHNFYQNLAIAYHNMYLFLGARGIDQQEYFDEARHYYKKARRAGTILHKAECDLLTAALYAKAGYLERAKKIVEKIDGPMLRSDFESMEYLAAYYAASGNAEAAVDALRAAYDINPARTMAWIEVGDDFHTIVGEPSYRSLLKNLKESSSKCCLTLSVPKEPEPRLDMTGSIGRRSRRR